MLNLFSICLVISVSATGFWESFEAIDAQLDSLQENIQGADLTELDAYKEEALTALQELTDPNRNMSEYTLCLYLQELVSASDGALDLIYEAFHGLEQNDKDAEKLLRDLYTRFSLPDNVSDFFDKRCAIRIQVGDLGLIAKPPDGKTPLPNLQTAEKFEEIAPAFLSKIRSAVDLTDQDALAGEIKEYEGYKALLDGNFSHLPNGAPIVKELKRYIDHLKALLPASSVSQKAIRGRG